MSVMSVQEARAGMVLASEVRDRTGRLLMVAGQEISDRALRVLRMWGVAEVDIEDGGADSGLASSAPAAAEDPAEAARVRAEVDDLFRHMDHGHPAVAELIRLSLHRRATGCRWHE